MLDALLNQYLSESSREQVQLLEPFGAAGASLAFLYTSGLRQRIRTSKAALETWTALLLEIERGERKVAPLRSRRSNS
jgi:hypothetical protein